MNLTTLEHWEGRGWLLDQSLNDSPGEVINTGGGPYYIGEAKEVGYGGNAHPLIVTRYLMGMRLGRPLIRNELVRFRSDNKKDFRLSNLILHSKIASAEELYRANGDPILGYSHCMCGCGFKLDLAQQKEQPYAYVLGHRPKPKEPKRSRRKVKAKKEEPINRIRNSLRKETIKGEAELLKVGQPLLVIKEEEDFSPMPVTPAPKSTTPCTDALKEMFEEKTDPMKEFRVLFEKMIHNLAWDEFKELLHLLLEIQTRKP